MKTFDEIFALATSPLHREYAETFTDPRLSWGVGVTQGVAVAMQEAQAEIDALKAENKRLQEKSEHSTIARFNWRNKYLTLIGSIIAILGLDDLTARDDVVLAVEALKAQNAELKAQVGKLADQCLHSDKMFKRSLLKRIAEQAEIKAERDALLAALEAIVEMNPALPMGMIEAAQKAIAKARGDQV